MVEQVSKIITNLEPKAGETLAQIVEKEERKGSLKVVRKGVEKIIIPARTEEKIQAELEKFKVDGIPRYIDYASILKLFDLAKETKLPLLLKGPTGVGKTLALETVAKKYDTPLVTIAGYKEVGYSDVIGSLIPYGDFLVWKDGPLIPAMIGGAVFYFDEVVNVENEVLALLHPLTDHRRYIVIPETKEKIDAHDDFVLVASYNPGSKYSRNKLSPAFEGRFLVKLVGYPPEDVEMEILLNDDNGGEISREEAAIIVDIMNEIREGASDEVKELPGVRASVFVKKLVTQGMAMVDAFEVVLSAIVDEKEELDGLMDIVRGKVPEGD